MKKLAAGIAVALAVVAGAASSPASAAVYWSNVKSGTIGRAGNDGSNVDQSFITGASQMQYLAVDAEHMYWANGTGGIGRANLDGSAVDQNFIPDVHPDALAVDSAHVYWTSLATNSVGRANLDGSAVDPALVTGLTFPVGLALDAGHVYWTDQFAQDVGRADLDGSNPEKQFITAVQGPVGLAVDGAHLYVSSPLERKIYRAELDGSGLDPLVVGVISHGIAVDSVHLYWTDSTTIPNGIARVRLDDQSIQANFIPGPSGLLGVAVDGVSVKPPALPAPTTTTPPPNPLPTSSAAAPPRLSGLSLSKRAFAVGRRGTSFSFRLDQSATVRVRIQRKLSGGRLRKRGTLTRAGRAGANRIRFTGRGVRPHPPSRPLSGGGHGRKRRRQLDAAGGRLRDRRALRAFRRR